MTFFPLAGQLSAALAPDVAMARTQEEAEAKSGGPVRFVEEEAPGAFATPEAAEAAYPGLYDAGGFELYWRDGAWRVGVRFWRPLPAQPVARTLEAALKRPLGQARSPNEAQALLGVPAALVWERTGQTYTTRKRALARWGKLIEEGLAEIEDWEGLFAVRAAFWRPADQESPLIGMTPAERSELALRAAAPLRPSAPQAALDIGLFEQPAPENPDIVLAEEGDGRFRGE